MHHFSSETLLLENAIELFRNSWEAIHTCSPYALVIICFCYFFSIIVLCIDNTFFFLIIIFYINDCGVEVYIFKNIGIVPCDTGCDIFYDSLTWHVGRKIHTTKMLFEVVVKEFKVLLGAVRPKRLIHVRCALFIIFIFFIFDFFFVICFAFIVIAVVVVVVFFVSTIVKTIITILVFLFVVIIVVIILIILVTVVLILTKLPI
mmetsp:Transcript_3376/g.6230  ORF Transcript_3376/g.6230 Transcript_3376/m.6230 type:complete len:204 (+) Transcript_3376:1244-1855(+)